MIAGKKSLVGVAMPIVFGILSGGVAEAQLSVRGISPKCFTSQGVKLHTIEGSGFTRQSRVSLSKAAFVGSSDSSADGLPAEVEADGSRLKVYIGNVDVEARASIQVRVENPDETSSVANFRAGEPSLAAVWPEQIKIGKDGDHYTFFGECFDSGVKVEVEGSATVGGGPGEIDSKPAAVAPDGSWLTVYIRIASHEGDSVDLVVTNPDGGKVLMTLETR